MHARRQARHQPGNHWIMAGSPPHQGLHIPQQLLGIETHAQVLDAQGPARVDEGGEEGVVHRAAGRLLGVDAVVPGHLLNLRRCPREERPASEVHSMGLGIALEHLRRIARIHGDGDKKHLGPEIGAEACLQPGQLRGQQRTGVGAGGDR